MRQGCGINKTLFQWGKDKNELNEGQKLFYSNWEDNEPILIPLQQRNVDNFREHYRFTKLNSKLYKLRCKSLNDQRDKVVKFKSDSVQFTVKHIRDEYRIKVSILI